MVRRAHGSAALANSSMLLQHSKNDKKRTNYTKSLCENFDLSQQCQCKVHNCRKHRSHGMFSIREKFVRVSLSEDAVNIVMSSWSKSTTAKYNAYIRQWMENRQKKNFILYNASLKYGIEFLTFLCENGRE